MGQIVAKTVPAKHATKQSKREDLFMAMQQSQRIWGYNMGGGLWDKEEKEGDWHGVGGRFSAFSFCW